MALVLRAAADGTQVAMADLRGAESPADAVAEARRAGAVELWAYGDGLEAHGFEPAAGYARLRAEQLPAGESLPETGDLDVILSLLERCYAGLWGHWRPDRELVEQSAARAGLHHLLLGDVGLCRVDEAAREIDAPGLAAEARSPERYARLVLGAAALLGPGPASLESWGDAPETIAAYEELGFRVVERLQGWRLRL
jgi:hypothetical protein